MSILDCSNDNSDKSSKTALEIKLIEEYQKQGQSWLGYEIIFHIGEKKYIFRSQDKKAITHTGIESEIGKFAFAISPHNEFDVFRDQLKKFLINEDKKTFRFEPSDPSFEIIIERIQSLDQLPSFKVYCWIDAGNTQQLEYTWDGLGLRMVTSKDKLESFSNSLAVN